MTMVDDPTALSGNLAGTGSVIGHRQYRPDHAAASALHAEGSATAVVAEKPFDAASKHFTARLTLLITNASDSADSLGGAQEALTRRHAPGRDAHRSRPIPPQAPRIAVMHTWLGTQTEGWWRQVFDVNGVPFTYISVQTAAAEARPSRQVRRHRLRASRPRQRAVDHQWLAQVRQRAALDEDRRDPQPGHRFYPRPARWPRLRRPRAPAELRRKGRPAHHVGRYRPVRRRDGPRPRRNGRAAR